MSTMSVFESLLYFLCAVTFSVKILNGAIKRKYLIYIFLCVYPPVIVLSMFYDKLFDLVAVLLMILGIIFIKFAIPKVNTFSIIYFYIFIFMNNIFIISLISSVLKIFTEDSFIVELIVNIVISVICLIVCFKIELREKMKIIVAWISWKIKILMIFYMLIVATISTLLYDTPYFSKKIVSWNLSIRILFIIVILLIFITIPVLILFSIVNKKMKLENEDYEAQLKSQADHYDKLSKANYELRKFRHDYKNYRIGISKLIANHKYDEALDLLEKCDEEFYDATDSIVKYDTGNGIVDALLMEKQKEVTDEDINIAFDGEVTPKAIEPIDMCVIFGNTVDNAIEACKKLPEDVEKNIKIDCECNSGIMFIKITNPVKGNVEIKDNFIETSKDDKTSHGFGITSLKRVLKKYDGEVKFSCDNNTFCTKISAFLNV
jgi:hypothetical protein